MSHIFLKNGVFGCENRCKVLSRNDLFVPRSRGTRVGQPGTGNNWIGPKWIDMNSLRL